MRNPSCRRLFQALSLTTCLSWAPVLAQTGTLEIVDSQPLSGSFLAKTRVAGSPQIAAYDDTFLMVGDTYAALSKDQGKSWDHHDPHALPHTGSLRIQRGGMRVLHERSWPLTLWVISYISPNPGASNKVWIGATRSHQELREMKFAGKLLSSTALGSRSDEYVQIHDAALDDDHLYLSLVVRSPTYKRSVVARFKLADIRDNKPLVPEKYTSDDIGGSRYGFARGCRQDMFFAAHESTSSMQVYRWNVNATNPTARTLTTRKWYDGSPLSVAPDGQRWMANDNHEIRTGYVRGNEVAFLFSSNRGGSMAHPFIRVARFSTSLQQLAAFDIFSTQNAWAFPALSIDRAGNIGVTASVGGPQLYPTTAVFLVDAAINHDWRRIQPSYPAYGTHSPYNRGWGASMAVVPHSHYVGNFICTGQTLVGGRNDIHCRHAFHWFARTSNLPSPIRLNVQSTYPGATIDVDVSDRNGQRSGRAPFTRRFFVPQSCRLTASPTIRNGNELWAFDGWLIDNALQLPKNPVVDVRGMTSTTSAKVCYRRAYELTLGSVHATNAPFVLDKVDVFGRRDGITRATRSYLEGTEVIVEFAAAVGPRRARRLAYNGTTSGTSSTTMKITMDRDSKVTVTYAYYTASQNSSFGTGCVGSNGTPDQTLSGKPETGEWVNHDIRQAVQSGRALLAIGLSNQAWSGVPLPLQLPGTACDLAVSPDLLLPLTTDAQGTGRLRFRLPFDWSLIGITYYSQFASLDPNAAAGITTSNGIEVKIGGWEER